MNEIPVETEKPNTPTTKPYLLESTKRVVEEMIKAFKEYEVENEEIAEKMPKLITNITKLFEKILETQDFDEPKRNLTESIWSKVSQKLDELVREELMRPSGAWKQSDLNLIEV